MSDLGLFFILLLLGLASLLLVVYVHWRQARVARARYRLFAVRDELSMLVVRGELDEDSVVFRTTCAQINAVIVNVRDFNLRALSRNYVEADEKSLSGKERRREYFAALAKSPPSVQQTVRHFYSALMDVLVDNSVLLHAFVLVKTPLHQLRRYLRKSEPIVQVVTRSPVVRAYLIVRERLAQVSQARAVHAVP